MKNTQSWQNFPSKNLINRNLKKRKKAYQKLNNGMSKNWWIHLWSGLVFDKDAVHQKKIRQAIWLYIYFLLVANRRTGVSFRRISTISKETGFQIRTIHRWLRILRENDYIQTQSNGRSLHITILRWKPISRKNIRKDTSKKQRY